MPITSPSPVTSSPRDPSHLIASEMIQLRMKLEEKRRAIEAQKKKVTSLRPSPRIRRPVPEALPWRCFLLIQVEAAFTRHRQKMGRTAFLNVVRRKGINAPVSPSSGGAETPSTEPATPSPEARQGGVERAERCKPDGAAPRSPCEDKGGESRCLGDGARAYVSPDRASCLDSGVTPGEADLADYTRSIERLNTSLGFLQTEMQRLAQQQEKIMAMREQQQQQQAWVIPAPAPSPHRYLCF